MNSLKLDIADNSTIGKECLGKKCLHLTKRRTGKLAINFINKIISFWWLIDRFYAQNLALSVTVSPNDADTSVSQNSQFKEQFENQNLGDSADEILLHLKLKTVNRLVNGHLSINSLRNKFDNLNLVKNSLDVLMISETKLDETFPEGQFLMDGFTPPNTPPYRMNGNTNGGGIALYVREDKSRQISFKNNDKDIEHFFVEINLCKKKWLILCTYNSHLQFIDKHLIHIGKGFDSLSSTYDDYILIGNFNTELSNNFVDRFCGFAF